MKYTKEGYQFDRRFVMKNQEMAVGELTLASVIVDIWVVGVMPNGSLKVAKGASGVA